MSNIMKYQNYLGKKRSHDNGQVNWIIRSLEKKF